MMGPDTSDVAEGGPDDDEDGSGSAVGAKAESFSSETA